MVAQYKDGPLYERCEGCAHKVGRFVLYRAFVSLHTFGCDRGCEPPSFAFFVPETDARKENEIEFCKVCGAKLRRGAD